MRNSLRKILKQPLYPWLLGIYPILHLYSENLGLVVDSEVIPTILFVLAGTCIVFIVCKRKFKDIHRAAVVTSLCSIVFSLSGHLYEMLFMPRSLLIWNIATAVLIGGFCQAFHKRLPQQIYARFTMPFNIISAALLAMQAVNLLSLSTAQQQYESIKDAYVQAEATRPTSPKILDSPAHPDIYYIIPDGYPSDAALASAMDYDNSAFTKALKKRGFAVAEQAQSNYGATVLSVPATLNMRYIDHNPTEYADIDYLHFLVANGAVQHWLLQRGYTYVQLMSGAFTPSPIADINRDFTNIGPIDLVLDDFYLDSSKHMFRIVQPFIPLYVDTTLLRIIRSQLVKLNLHYDKAPLGFLSPQRFLDMIESVDDIAAMPEATFTFIHLLKPHEPITFDAQGNVIAAIDSPNHEQFFAEFGFVNALFLELIDKILTGSDNPPVIIFQADHGSFLGITTTKDNRWTHFDINSAILLPKSKTFRYPQPYTAVNTFPLVLNALFDANLALQEDRLIELLHCCESLFKQQDVTDQYPPPSLRHSFTLHGN